MMARNMQGDDFGKREDVQSLLDVHQFFDQRNGREQKVLLRPLRL